MRLLSMAVVVFLLALAVVGCGDGDDENYGATGSPGASGATAAANTRDCPPSKKKPSFDLRLLVGQPVDVAESYAKSNDYTMRAVWVDGEALAATMDYNPKRLNVAVRDDKVTQLCSIG
ncbi:MAG: hypothetical protein HZB14_02485 [Actinobacteria bacterium]|nr:hypothetical protein [Actinomycetota bacterium]